MSKDPSATGSGPTSPALGSPVALAPITKLAPELLVHTLCLLRESCSTALNRQAESQNFLRVCRSFHSAYVFSEAVHECAVPTVEHLIKLAHLLNPDSMAPLSPRQPVKRQGGPIRELWLGADKLGADELVELVVRGCPHLRELVWAATWPSKGEKGALEDGLVKALADCVEMRYFDFVPESRQLSGGQAQRLLAGWTRLYHLHLYSFDLVFTEEPLHTKPPSSWTLPTRLRSLELYVDSAAALELLAALVNASSDTLVDLQLVVLDMTPFQVQEALPDAGGKLESLRYYLGDNGEGSVDCVPAIVERFPALHHLELPTSAVADGALADVLKGRSPLRSLELQAGGSRELTRRAFSDFLRAVKVVHLRVDQFQWELWEEMEVDLLYEEEDKSAGSPDDPLADWRGEVEALVTKFELI